FAHLLFDVGGRSLFRVAADLTNHHDGVRIWILIEQPDGIDEVGPDDGIAADTNARRLPNAEPGQLAHRFICQRARARNHTHVPFEVDVGRHDSDLALAGRNDARAVGADEPR